MADYLKERPFVSVVLFNVGHLVKVRLGQAACELLTWTYVALCVHIGYNTNHSNRIVPRQSYYTVEQLLKIITYSLDLDLADVLMRTPLPLFFFFWSCCAASTSSIFHFIDGSSFRGFEPSSAFRFSYFCSCVVAPCLCARSDCPPPCRSESWPAASTES